MTRSILLADDSLTIQKAVALSLSGEDVQLAVVGNGDEALSRARELRRS